MGVIGVLVSGAGSNLQALLEAGLPVAAVASNTADARALDRARAAGTPGGRVRARATIRDRDARDVAMADWLAGKRRRARRLRRLHAPPPTGFLERFPDSVVNVHPALLPAFPGAHAVEDALAAGVGQTGATVHLVDEGVDTGTRAPSGGRPDPPRATPSRRSTRASRRSSIVCCPRSSGS